MSLTRTGRRWCLSSPEKGGRSVQLGRAQAIEFDCRGLLHLGAHLREIRMKCLVVLRQPSDQPTADATSAGRDTSTQGRTRSGWADFVFDSVAAFEMADTEARTSKAEAVASSAVPASTSAGRTQSTITSAPIPSGYDCLPVLVCSSVPCICVSCCNSASSCAVVSAAVVVCWETSFWRRTTAGQVQVSSQIPRVHGVRRPPHARHAAVAGPRLSKRVVVRS